MMKYVIYTGVLFMPDKNAAAQRANAFARLIKLAGFMPVIIGMNIENDSNCILNSKEYRDNTLYFAMNYPNSTTSWLKMLFDYRQIVVVMEELGKENIHSIIAMDYFAPALNGLMSYCTKNKIRFIVDTVDWFAKSQYSFPKNIVKDLDTNLRMKWLNKKADYMITISEYLKAYYENSKKRIVQIPGIYAQGEEQCDLLRIDKTDSKILAFVGSPGLKCEKEKIDWVIKAICKINSETLKIQFLIAGIDKETLRKNRPDLTDLPQFDQSILCLGKIEHDECLKLISSSDFSVIIREDSLLSNAGFPTKLGESFACGTPVLVTPTSDIKKYIPTGYGIITENCTYDAVEKSLVLLTTYSAEDITRMHALVKSDNPLSYEKYIDEIKEVLG